MPMSYDDAHPCPVCGGSWKVPAVFPRQSKQFRSSESGWVVPEDQGWCSNPDCRITDAETREYRALRRSRGWDPT
jgi:hypothetical protein